MALRMRRMGREYESDSDKQRAARLTRKELSTYGRLLQYVRPYWPWMLVSIIALLFSVGLGLILPLVIRNLVDLILDESKFAAPEPVGRRLVCRIHLASLF